MPRLLGLDIDKKYLRISAAETRLRQVKFLKTGSIALPEDREERGKVILETLQQWKAAYTPHGVVAGVPLEYFSCRPLDMPVMSSDDMRRALPFELEKHLPLAIEDYNFDFLMKKSAGMMKTLVFSIKKEVVLDIVRLIAGAGLEVVSVRSRTVDALNSMLRVTGDKSMTGLFVQNTGSAYEIACVESSVPVHLARAPMDEDLIVELDRLSEKYPGSVYFSGAIDERTAERFHGHKIDVSPAEALIISYVRKTGRNLDFIPAELAKPKKDPYPYLIGGFASAAVLLFILTGFISYFKDAGTLRGIEARTAEIKSRAAGVIETRRKLELLGADRKTLADFLNGSNRAVRTMRNLSNSVPRDTWILSLTVDEKGMVEMEGFSRKSSELIMSLEKAAHFKNISFAAPIIAKGGEERFSLRLEAKE